MGLVADTGFVTIGSAGERHVIDSDSAYSVALGDN